MGDVLGHMQRDANATHLSDKAFCVLPLIGTHGFLVGREYQPNNLAASRSMVATDWVRWQCWPRQPSRVGNVTGLKLDSYSLLLLY